MLSSGATNKPGIYFPFGHCGFRVDHAIRVYSSPDLVNWTSEGEILPASDRPEGIYFRPKVKYNARTKEFVLWVNYLAPAHAPLFAYRHARLLVATSKQPTHGFRIVTQKANLSVDGAGDFDIFVDNDGKAYVAYDAWMNDHTVLIEQLTEDYTDSLGAMARSEPLSPKNNEAPILFRRGETYFLMYGHVCCFCKEGTNAHVKIATSPLGPWNDTCREVFDGAALKARFWDVSTKTILSSTVVSVTN